MKTARDRPLRSRRWKRPAAAGAGVLLGVLLLGRFVLLPRLPGWLTAQDAPVRSDLAIALGGDSSGSREAGAARLWREGMAHAMICSGRDLLWHVNEADAMAAHARFLGVPSERIICSREGENTAGEAAHILPLARARGARSVLLVTTSIHSRRARLLFRRAWRDAGIQIRSCPVESPYFRSDRWWTRARDREILTIELLSWARVVIGR